MAGTLIEICPMRVYDFSLLNESAGQMSMPVAERIDVSQWTEGSLIVRVLTVDIEAEGDDIAVTVSPDGFTYESPASIYVGAPVATAAFDSTMQAPGFLISALSLPFGPMLRVDVAGIRNTGGVTALSARLSICLSMKSGVIGRSGHG